MNKNKFSLTGDEFLDFLSWCEIQGINFEENKEQENQEIQQEEQNSQILIKKMKGRDKYE